MKNSKTIKSIYDIINLFLYLDKMRIYVDQKKKMEKKVISPLMVVLYAIHVIYYLLRGPVCFEGLNSLFNKVYDVDDDIPERTLFICIYLFIFVIFFCSMIKKKTKIVLTKKRISLNIDVASNMTYSNKVCTNCVAWPRLLSTLLL